MAEWLRRWTAIPMGSARVSSNLILVANILSLIFELFMATFLAESQHGYTTVLACPHMLNLSQYVQ